MRRRVLFAALLYMLLSAGRARANGPEVTFDGSSLYPVDSRVIQLVSEKVDIDLSRPAESEQNARCVYVLRNPSDSTQHFTMAFVTGTLGWSAEYLAEFTTPLKGFAFEVRQDGRGIPVRLLPGWPGATAVYGDSPPDSLPAWSLTIGPRSTSTIRMRYHVEWMGGGDDPGSSYFVYFATPAARWAGRIERASFRVRLGDGAFVRRLRRTKAPWSSSFSPSGYEWRADGVVWNFRDWEPDTDLRIYIEHPSFYDAPNDPSWNPWSSPDKASLPSLTRGLDQPPVVLEAGRCLGEFERYTGPPVTTRLRIYVDEDGKVGAVRYLDSPTDSPNAIWSFIASCVRLDWRFKPAQRAGRAVGAWTDLEVVHPRTP